MNGVLLDVIMQLIWDPLLLLPDLCLIRCFNLHFESSNNKLNFQGKPTDRPTGQRNLLLCQCLHRSLSTEKVLLSGSLGLRKQPTGTHLHFLLHGSASGAGLYFPHSRSDLSQTKSSSEMLRNCFLTHCQLIKYKSISVQGRSLTGLSLAVISSATLSNTIHPCCLFIWHCRASSSELSFLHWVGRGKKCVCYRYQQS